MNEIGWFEIDNIITGDARVLSTSIPDGSIGMIFSDPPYLREYLHLYRWLAETAARVLKPGGYLFAYGAGEHLPAMLEYMTVPGMNWFWMDVILHNGAYPRIWYKKLLSAWKPIICYTKGKPSVLRWRATAHNPRLDKQFHEWGQGISPAIKLIQMLTGPDDIIFDPFMGGGTTAAACKIVNRRFIGCEIDAGQAEIARVRVDKQQPALFTWNEPEIQEQQFDLDCIDQLDAGEGQPCPHCQGTGLSPFGDGGSCPHCFNGTLR